MSIKLRMAVNSVEVIALAFFVTECRGVKFYDFKDDKLGFGTELLFVRRGGLTIRRMLTAWR